MIKIKFKIFFDNIGKNYNHPATTPTSLKLNEKEKIEIKIGTNTNKFIFEIEDEKDLIDLFTLNFNSMSAEPITPENTKISKEERSKIVKAIISSLDGVSTHLIKFPEASRAAGQIFIKKNKLDENFFAIDSNSYFFGKEKIYAQNATTMKFARAFTNDFIFEDKIISYLEVFSNLKDVKIFNNFVKEIFKEDLVNITKKTDEILNGVVNIFHENTIINIPVNNEYISTSPIVSTKILNALQYSNYYKEGFNTKHLRIAVGGANPQNAADYLSNIGGSQKLLISVPPQIKISKNLANKYLYKYNHGFSRSLVNCVNFIQDLFKDSIYKEHITTVLNLAYKEKNESFENNILDKSVFINNLIDYKIKDLLYVVENFYNLIEKSQIDGLRYNESLMHLINKKNKLTKIDDDSDYAKKINSFIDIYEKNSFEDNSNIEIGIINDILLSLEYDFAKYTKNENKVFEQNFSKILKNKINNIIFGEKNG